MMAVVDSFVGQEAGTDFTRGRGDRVNWRQL